MKFYRLAGLIVAVVLMVLPLEDARATSIDLGALGLEAEATPFLTDPAATAGILAGAFLGGSDFLADPFVSASGFAPFTDTSFVLSVTAFAPPGTIDGASIAAGTGLDEIEVLFAVPSATGTFASISDLVLATFTGSFGADPLGLDFGVPTLGFPPAAAVLTLTNVSVIPEPGTLPMMVSGLAVFAAIIRRRSIRAV